MIDLLVWLVLAALSLMMGMALIWAVGAVLGTPFLLLADWVDIWGDKRRAKEREEQERQRVHGAWYHLDRKTWQYTEIGASEMAALPPGAVQYRWDATRQQFNLEIPPGRDRETGGTP